MITFKELRQIIDLAWIGKSRKLRLRAAGLAFPATITSMCLRGEPVDYVTAAVLAVNQIGE